MKKKLSGGVYYQTIYIIIEKLLVLLHMEELLLKVFRPYVVYDTCLWCIYYIPICEVLIYVLVIGCIDFL